jgi:hypothetical protein
MELLHFIIETIVCSPQANREKPSKRLQKQEVELLRYLHDSFEAKNKRGSLRLYLELRGWPNIYYIFGGYAGFLSAMKEAGYKKGFISEKKDEWQKLFNEGKSE